MLKEILKMSSSAPKPQMSLLSFLQRAKQTALTPHTTSSTKDAVPTFVIGNQSADLDSMVSAIIYAFSSAPTQPSDSSIPKTYAPIINLAKVPSGKELQRLRPEFCVAFREAATFSAADRGSKSWEIGSQQEVEILQQSITTVHDLRSAYEAHPSPSTTDDTIGHIPTVLVDWNATPTDSRISIASDSSNSQPASAISGLTDLPNAPTLIVSGVVDHHVDEDFVLKRRDTPEETEPRIVTTGIGSCATLVVQYLKDSGRWNALAVDNESSSIIAQAQASILALSAILIDTTNLTSQDKTSQLDIKIVTFLETQIKEAEDSLQVPAGQRFNRDAFFDKVADAKKNALNLLTTKEILERDYKEWVEEKSGSEPVKIGIASAVKSLSWIIHPDKRAGVESSPSSISMTAGFKAGLASYAAEMDLDILMIMTAFTAGDKFRREILLSQASDSGGKIIEQFIDAGKGELGLEDIEISGSRDETSRLCAFQQLELGKSRKQVAPLIRKIAKEEM